PLTLGQSHPALSLFDAEGFSMPTRRQFLNKAWLGTAATLSIPGLAAARGLCRRCRQRRCCCHDEVFPTTTYTWGCPIKIVGYLEGYTYYNCHCCPHGSSTAARCGGYDLDNVNHTLVPAGLCDDCPIGNAVMLDTYQFVDNWCGDSSYGPVRASDDPIHASLNAASTGADYSDNKNFTPGSNVHMITTGAAISYKHKDTGEDFKARIWVAQLREDNWPIFRFGIECQNCIATD